MAGGAAEPAGFDLRRVTALDGDKENLDDLPSDTISPFVFQSYGFAIDVDAENLPAQAALRFVFKEKMLNRARLEVYQASTGIWHPFEIDTLVSEDAEIDVTVEREED